LNNDHRLHVPGGCPAEAFEKTSNCLRRKLPEVDGIYLYMCPVNRAATDGTKYMVFEVRQGKTIGAFIYRTQSLMFHGTSNQEKLALMIANGPICPSPRVGPHR